MEISKGLRNRHNVAGIKLEEQLLPVYSTVVDGKTVKGVGIDKVKGSEVEDAVAYLNTIYTHHHRQARYIELSWALYKLTGKVIEYTDIAKHTTLHQVQGTAKQGNWLAESYIASNFNQFNTLSEFKAHLHNLNQGLFDSIINYKFYNYLGSIYAIEGYTQYLKKE